MAETNVYDLAVLGSGPGGYVAAIRAGQLGLKTIVVEKDDFLGGTCLHVGCIPTKALLQTAEIMNKLGSAAQFGVVVEKARLDWEALQKRKDRIVRKLAAGVAYLFKKNGVESIRGFGSFAGAGRLDVKSGGETNTLHARNIIIATGSEPRSLPGLEIDGESVITNEEILALPTQPKSLAVIGAGAVGVEFASMFASFGTKVILLEILPRVLPLEDEEISKTLEKMLGKRGIETLTGTRVGSITKKGQVIEITATSPDGNTVGLGVEKLLVAVGR